MSTVSETPLIDKDFLVSKVDEIVDYYSSKDVYVDRSVVRSWLIDWWNIKQPLLKYIGNDLVVKLTVQLESKECNKEERFTSFLFEVPELASKLHFYSFAKEVDEDFRYVVRNGTKTRIMKYIKSLISERYHIQADQEYEKFRNDLKLSNGYTETVHVSIDPLDYIKASEETSGGWRSCFAVDGEYHCTTNAFMRTEGVFIWYINDSKGLKKQRQWCVINDERTAFAHSGVYPNSNGTDVVIHKAIGNLFELDSNLVIENAISIDIFYDVPSGGYLDTFYGNWIKSFDSIEVADPQDCKGEEPYNDGYFLSNCESCPECGSRTSRDSMIYVIDLDDYVCECCINGFNYCVDDGEYRRPYNTIYLEIDDCWVSDEYDGIRFSFNGDSFDAERNEYSYTEDTDEPFCFHQSHLLYEYNGLYYEHEENMLEAREKDEVEEYV